MCPKCTLKVVYILTVSFVLVSRPPPQGCGLGEKRETEACTQDGQPQLLHGPSQVTTL